MRTSSPQITAVGCLHQEKHAWEDRTSLNLPGIRKITMSGVPFTGEQPQGSVRLKRKSCTWKVRLQVVNQQSSVHELSSLPLQLGPSLEFCWPGILPARPLSLLGSRGFPKLCSGSRDCNEPPRRLLSTGLPRSTLKPRAPGRGAGWGRKFFLAPRPRPLALSVPSPAGCPALSHADLVTLTSAVRGGRGDCELGTPGRAMGQGELGRWRGGRPSAARSLRASEPAARGRSGAPG